MINKATPWEYDERRNEIRDASHLVVVDMDGSDYDFDFDAKHASFIIQAANNHDQLVEALKRCVTRMTAELPDPQDIDELYFALETLAAAEKP